jgi:polyisoprenoid-binding protein YceI
MRTWLLVLAVSACALIPSAAGAQGVPVFKIAPDQSTIKFSVKASVKIEGAFKKWDATLVFTSPDVTTGVLDIRVRADSVDTGSGMKDATLKSRDFFDVDENPYITFHSTKVVQTGPGRLDVLGDFTIRGVTKSEKLALTVAAAGARSGKIKGTMAFDRKDFGMDSGIPFIRIADRVEVTVNLSVKRVGGPPLALER